MDPNYQLLLCTCPNVETAERIAQALVAKRLAACVNILHQLKSIYRWQDRIETAQEYLLIIKSLAHLYPNLETLVREMHPYEVPELIAMPIIQGSPDYLNWLSDSCHAL